MSAAHLIGQRYQLGGSIGQGGMGAVYRARDTHSGQTVAVKELRPDLVHKASDAVQRFNREAEALRQLNHPHIVKVFHAFEEDGHHYIVMEYVSGGSLRDLLQETPALPVQRVVSIALDLADALTRAHRLNIIHRDLKPANVLLAEDGTPRLTDFGVARIGGQPQHLTETGAMVGTLGYMSPEAAQGDSLDARSDIWGFGVMLFEMLTGQRPFERAHPGATMLAILQDPLPDLEALRPDAPITLIDLIYRMLSKEREARIPSVRLVGAELEAILQGTSVGAYSGTQPPALLEDRADFHNEERFATPTPTATGVLPHNLPAQPTPFVGREPELADLARLLADPAVRLITILGPGGMGKTRLAVEAAGRILGATQQSRTDKGPKSAIMHGVFFVPLAPITSPDLIASTIADCIGFTFYGAEMPERQLVDYLREKEMLLVLDNFEHVVAGAGLVADILRDAPGVRVLVSSRERLRLQGEWAYDVQGMTFPDWETPDDLAAYSSVQLFLQSARRVQPAFEINADTAHCVARIVRLVEGLPLGIELAAAWLEALMPSEIVDEMERSLDFLETDLRDVPDRHRSLRAVFDYSWNLLSADEREAFCKLAVFRGGFERDAAQQVTGAGLRTLTGLVNKSLLRRTPEGRYDIHEMLRQYAAQELDSHPERAAARDAHCAYYVALLHQHGQDLGGAHMRRAIQSIEHELENVRAAVWHAVETQMIETMHPALEPLRNFYELRSFYIEGMALFERIAAALSGQPQHRHTYGYALACLAATISRLAEYERGLRIGEEALAILQEVGTPSELGVACNALSYNAMWLSRYDEARDYGQQALDLFRQHGPAWQVSYTQANLGYIYHLMGEYGRARELHERSIALARELGTEIGVAFGLNNLGEVLFALGELKEARRLYNESYALFEQIGYTRGLGFTLNNLGGLDMWIGDHAQAELRFKQSLDVHRDLGDRAGIAHSLSLLGNIAEGDGRFAEARRLYIEALAVRRASGDLRRVADSLRDLGGIASLLEEYPQAIAHYDEGLAVRRQIGDPQGEAVLLLDLGDVALAQDDHARARAFYLEGQRLSESIGDHLYVNFGRVNLATLYADEGDYAAARQLVARTLSELEHSGLVWLKWALQFFEGYMDLKEGDMEQARRRLLSSLRGAVELHMDFLVIFGLLAAAIFFEATGQPVRAVELLALVEAQPGYYNHDPMLKTRRVEGRHLHERIEAALRPDEIAAAQSRGQALQLYGAAQALLEEP